MKKRVFANMASGFLCKVVMILLGIIASRIVLQRMGSEINGILTSINGMQVYLMILESGIGLASIQALYQPAARGERRRISDIMTASYLSYRRVSRWFLLCLTASGLLYAAVMDSCLPRPVMFLIFVLFGLPSLLVLRFQAVYNDYLRAEGRTYVIFNAMLFARVLSYAIQITLLYVTDNILLIVAASYGIVAVQPFLVRLYARRNYPWLDLHTDTPDHDRIRQKSSVLVHKVTEMIFNNSDVLILSLMTNFLVVSVYTVYHYVYASLETVVDSVVDGVKFTLGQAYTEEPERFRDMADSFETVYLTLGFILFTGVYLLILPFVRLYTAGIRDIEYVDEGLALLFTVIELLIVAKFPLMNLLNISGQFENTRHHAVWEAVLNIVVSVAATWRFSIYGVLCGTVAALLYRHNRMAVYANRTVLGRSAWRSYGKLAFNLGLFALAAFLHRRFEPAILSAPDMLIWCVPYGLGLIVLYGANFLLHPAALRMLVQIVRRPGKTNP